MSANQSIYDQPKVRIGDRRCDLGKGVDSRQQKAVEASQASVESLDSVVLAADSSCASPSRWVAIPTRPSIIRWCLLRTHDHPGAMVGPSAGAASAMLKLEQLSKIRLLVAVPETEYTSVVPGAARPGSRFQRTGAASSSEQ
jgi:hypothetical protein